MSNYANLPTGVTLDIKPFRAHVPESKLQHFKQLLELSPVAPPTFENTNAGCRYGLERTWVENAKYVWLTEFDWRKHEDRINSFPSFKTTVKDADDNDIELHFLALFSERADAVPIAFLHGYPGSNCEFMDLLDLLKDKYEPKDLPYHVVVPSLPGYAYSSGLPTNADYDVDLAASAINNLMVGLGFGSGYLAQGGDLGSFVSRALATKYDACKGIHVNMLLIPNDPPMNTDAEKRVLSKVMEFTDTQFAAALHQGQRPATLGMTLSSSPLALLCWVGEKLRDWADGGLPLEKVLEGVTLYWMTDSIPRCMWHSRGIVGGDEKPRIARASVQPPPPPYVAKPTGYSLFANEIIPAPKSWAAQVCNLVSFNEHESGGHFAAMERPSELLADVEEYVKKLAWKGAGC